MRRGVSSHFMSHHLTVRFLSSLTFQQEGAPHLSECLPPDRRHGTCTDGGQARAFGGPLAPE